MSKFFIHRPVFAGVLAIIMMIAGGLAIMQLPIAQYPRLPACGSHLGTYPGADAQTAGHRHPCYRTEHEWYR